MKKVVRRMRQRRGDRSRWGRKEKIVETRMLDVMWRLGLTKGVWPEPMWKSWIPRGKVVK